MHEFIWINPRSLRKKHIQPPSGPDLAGGRPGAQPNYGSISVTGASLGAHKTRGSQSPLRPRSSTVGARIEAPKALRGVGFGEGCPHPLPTGGEV